MDNNLKNATKLLELLRIYNNNAGKFITIKDIQEQSCGDINFERKTIYAYNALLRDFGYNISDYDKVKKGYIFKSHQKSQVIKVVDKSKTSFSTENLREQSDLINLYGLPINSDFSSLIKKIDDKKSKITWEDIEAVIKFDFKHLYKDVIIDDDNKPLYSEKSDSLANFERFKKYSDYKFDPDTSCTSIYYLSKTNDIYKCCRYRIQNQDIGKYKFELRTDENLNLRGDTMNSFTTIKNIAKRQKVYKALKSDFINFASLTHTLGNFWLIPKGMNKDKNAFFNDFMDLTLMNIYHYFMEDLDEVKFNLKSMKKWLSVYGDSQTGWNNFVIQNLLQDYVHTDKENNYTMPLELYWGSSQKLKATAKENEIRDCVTEMNKRIYNRSLRIVIRLTNNEKAKKLCFAMLEI